MGKKNQPIEAVAYKPSLQLSGEHAKKFAGHKLGAKMKLIVHGKKTSHSIYKGAKGDEHSMSMEIDRVCPYGEKEEGEE